MKTYLLLISFFALTLQNRAQTVSDTDGNIYNTVTIGTQVWMQENLRTTKYNDSTTIPNVTQATAWNALSSPAYCWFNNDALNFKTPYGAYYNWYAINTGKLCPIGWHVPTSAEWTTLVTYLGGTNVAGGKMKESGTTHWIAPNLGADNSSGFTGMPGGFRDTNNNGLFDGLRYYGMFWLSSETNVTQAWNANLAVAVASANISDNGIKKDGECVRCLKSVNADLNQFNSTEHIFIYPNPANNLLRIKDFNGSNAFALIYDIQGKKLLSKPLTSEPIDISTLSKGIYLIRIIDSGNTLVGRLIKN